MATPERGRLRLVGQQPQIRLPGVLERRQTSDPCFARRALLTLPLPLYNPAVEPGLFGVGGARPDTGCSLPTDGAVVHGVIAAQIRHGGRTAGQFTRLSNGAPASAH